MSYSMSPLKPSLLKALLLSVFASASLFTPPCSAVTYAANKVTLTDLTGSPQPNRPFSLSRVFAQGEIASYAQPRVAGVPLTTWQCDRMNSWPDGSLKHAIISFTYTLPSNSQPLVVDFVNNANPSSAGDAAATQAAALSQAAMLAFDPGTGAGTWGAEIDATQGVTQTANARTMLAAGAWRYWLRGPVVTQVIVEDRTPGRAYDFGWQCASNCTSTDYTQVTWTKAGAGSDYQSLHPIFVLTFYNGWHGVQTDYIVEDSWSDRLQDQEYNLALKAHSDNSLTEYTYPNFWHNAATRWRRRFWDGTTPARVKTDLTFPYLVKSHAFLNWDTTRTVGSTAIGLETASFQSAMANPATFMTDLPENLLSPRSTGQYQPEMGMPGGRPELGPLARWDVRWLYTQDDGLYRAMIANANTVSAIPSHVREARTDNYLLSSDLDPNRVTKAFGYFYSVDARPTVQLYNISTGNSGDQTVPVGTTRCNNNYVSGYDQFCTLPLSSRDASTTVWYPEASHYDATAYPAYIATGDWYYLDELYSVASYFLAYQPLNGSMGLLSHYNFNLRGTAWQFRHVAFAAFAAPDGDKEGAYLNQKLGNNIASEEGRFNVQSGSYYNNAAWQYGRTTLASYYNNLPNGPGNGNNPLRIPYFQIYNINNGNNDRGYFATGQVMSALSPWQGGYWTLALGWAKGFAVPDADTLLGEQAKYWINLVQKPGTPGYTYNPYLAAMLDGPAIDMTDNWFQSTSAMLNAWTTSMPSGSANCCGYGVGLNFQTLNSWTADTGVYNEVLPDYMDHGYNWILAAAVAVSAPYSDSTSGLAGQGSWTWINSANAQWAAFLGSNGTESSCSNGTPDQHLMNCDNPKWGIVPVSTKATVNACDVNGDGVVDSKDVQAAASQVVDGSPCTAGSCDATYVQRVTDAVLTGQCTL